MNLPLSYTGQTKNYLQRLYFIVHTLHFFVDSCDFRSGIEHLLADMLGNLLSALVAEVVLKAGPEILGNGADLYLGLCVLNAR